MATTEKGQGAAPEGSIKQEENFALTGFFSDGRKRIDIVLVFKDDESDEIKEMCLTFLMNIIQFGLEAEIEPGKMSEHKNLTFVKVHAPDAIIEECGIYFNEKSWFKDGHLEYINPNINIFAMSNERELIKIARKQYPGPGNYSTLERSNIVYKILLKLPFGKYNNYFGVNKLIENGIIQDAFALHDGPYFIVPKQSDVNMNARQVLFLEWLGMLNFWKWQPIHMIHEYFGKRVSYYFAFYEYFNFMLMIPLVCGVYTIYFLYEDKHIANYYDILESEYGVCHTYGHFTCPECRNYTLCPTIKTEKYCTELKLLKKIDKKETYRFGFMVAVWGVFFLIPWLYRERYLSWIWEENRKHTNQLVTIDYKEPEKKTENEIGAKKGKHDQKTNIKEGAKNKKGINISGCLLNIFIYILQLTCLVLWAIFIFKLSIVIWHYPRWMRFLGNAEEYIYKEKENEYLTMGAGIYTIIVFFLKKGFMVLAQKITRYENNKTYLTYQRSIATKMYAISFIGSFTILIMYTYLGMVQVHLRNNVDKPSHFMFGYGTMNSGFGCTLDDIGITLFVITTLEHAIFRMPAFMKGKTDYPACFDSRVPCWEREYKLKPMNEFLFHKRYNDLAMQFAIITCFSMLFPVASMLLFIMNIWDIRHFARQLLLEYRRPLLINTSGPGFWKHLILITALYAQFSSTSIQVCQSQKYLGDTLQYVNIHFLQYERAFMENITDKCTSKEDFDNMMKLVQRNHRGAYICYYRTFYNDLCQLSAIERQFRRIMVNTVGVAAIALCLFYVIPRTSRSLEDAIKAEQRLKNKYQTRSTCALLN